ncbi:unnamed protein product [Hydatigera taeniaeformis]|uniref:EF-hand domain-containing protein n=1 Tax=Hydatigena taeniaeformis TaxID=6205 RepID=A0A0R3XAW7_HYDTA|nr:unnamed protein product [Hydatigera taeniaeformis]
MLFNLATVKHAFDNAADGKHYLNHDDLEVFFIELFGQRPSQRLLTQICNSFDVNSAGNPVGLSLPKTIEFLKSELSCNLALREGPRDDELLSIFQALDSRGSNFITLKDLVGRANCRVLRGCLRFAFRSFDTDGDGRVSYRDFIEGIQAGRTAQSFGL